jgi:hypothetical protein
MPGAAIASISLYVCHPRPVKSYDRRIHATFKGWSLFFFNSPYLEM